MISSKHVIQYQQEGYTVCPDFLPKRELDELTAYIDHYIDQETAKGRRPEHLDKPHFEDEHFVELCSRPAILDQVEQFIGPNIVLFSTHIICKAKGDGLPVPWHQDGFYWPLEPMNVITLWIAIDDSTVENGCMRVVPGTHTLGPIEHIDVEDPQRKVLHKTVPPERFDECMAVDIVIPRGGCSFHAPYLIHGSAPNVSQKRRCGFTMRLMPPETRLRRSGGVADWFKGHKLYLLRGKDTARVNEYANA